VTIHLTLTQAKQIEALTRAGKTAQEAVDEVAGRELERELAHRALAAPWRKTCSCGIAYDLAGWKALPFKGIQPDPEEPLELKDCACGSTMAVVLTKEGRRLP
jgi:hypothetical protein